MIKLLDHVVTPTIFPDKTSQVWKLPDELLDRVYRENFCTVEWEFESEAELLHLAQLKTLLDTYCDSIHLLLPYLPYGRQDKRVDNGSTFALATFARLINALGFQEVQTMDAHCFSRAQAIKGLCGISPRPHIEKAAESVDADTLLYPDEGASQRYKNICAGIAEWTHATKERDQGTGRITSVKVVGNLRGWKVLIVDDICDGGATFKMVAKEALKKKAKEVHLYVTHGIFSQGIQTLRDSGIKRIFTRKGEIR